MMRPVPKADESSPPTSEAAMAFGDGVRESLSVEVVIGERPAYGDPLVAISDPPRMWFVPLAGHADTAS